MKSAHNLNIQRLESVPSWSDEVKAGVYSQIYLVGTAGLLLLQHVGLMLVVEELDNWHPGVTVVDIVSEARGVNNRQANYEKSVHDESIAQE